MQAAGPDFEQKINATSPPLPREPDSEFIKAIKQHIREELNAPAVVTYRRALERRLDEQSAPRRDQAEGDLADRIVALSTDVAIGRVLLPATQDCLYAKGPHYHECTDCRPDIVQAAEQLLGWFLLSSIRRDYVDELYPAERWLPALYFEIPVMTATEVEIIVARKFQRPSQLKLDASGRAVVGRTQICSGPNAFIWQKTARVKDFQRAVWNAVMGQEKATDLDRAELRQLNEELAFFQSRAYEPLHFYLPVMHAREEAQPEFDTAYAELLRDLPNLTLVRFGVAGPQGAFVVPEEKIIVAIRHFLDFTTKALV